MHVKAWIGWSLPYFGEVSKWNNLMLTKVRKTQVLTFDISKRAIFTCTESTCANFDFQSEMDYLQLGQTTKAFYIFGRSTSGPCGQMNGVRGVVERLKQMSLTPAFTMDSSSMTLPNLQLLRRRSVGKKMYPRATWRSGQNLNEECRKCCQAHQHSKYPMMLSHCCQKVQWESWAGYGISDSKTSASKSTGVHAVTQKFSKKTTGGRMHHDLRRPDSEIRLMRDLRSWFHIVWICMWTWLVLWRLYAKWDFGQRLHALLWPDLFRCVFPVPCRVGDQWWCHTCNVLWTCGKWDLSMGPLAALWTFEYWFLSGCSITI